MSTPDKSTPPCGPMQIGESIRVSDVNGADRTLQLQLDKVTQRNWSRICMGTATATDARYFVKQNFDRSGYVQADHWHYEQAGAKLAVSLFGKVVRVPPLLLHNPDLYINIFEYVDLQTLNTLLRSDSELFHSSFPTVLNKVIEVLDVMQQGATPMLNESLPVKQRDYGGPSVAINFKGFDIRNIGFARNPDARINTSEILIFDFVRPYLAPVEEAAAKLFVSIGLLNWGRPLRRFVRGPDLELLADSARQLRPYLDQRAVAAELRLQSSFRSREIQGSGYFETTLKTVGVSTIGRAYFSKLSRWCNDNLS